jgi:hypothetical protein
MSSPKISISSRSKEPAERSGAEFLRVDHAAVEVGVCAEFM